MKFIRKVSVIINYLIPISNLTRASNIFFEERRKNRAIVGWKNKKDEHVREMVIKKKKWKIFWYNKLLIQLDDSLL